MTYGGLSRNSRAFEVALPLCASHSFLLQQNKAE
jgi:hypothetical protein